MVQALDVIWFFDTEIDPNKWKMVVCICPEDGLFYRINSYDEYPIGVPIPLEPNHTGFLKWDSFISCGKIPLELDDYTIAQGLARSNNQRLGQVHQSHAAAINAAVQLQVTASRELREVIRKALGC